LLSQFGLLLGNLSILLSQFGLLLSNHSFSHIQLDLLISDLIILLSYFYLLISNHSIFSLNHFISFCDLLLLLFGFILKGGQAIMIIEGRAWVSLFTVSAYQNDFRAVIDEMVSHASMPREKFLTSTIQDTLAFSQLMRQKVLLSALVLVDGVAEGSASEFPVIQDISDDVVQLARSAGVSAARAMLVPFAPIFAALTAG